MAIVGPSEFGDSQAITHLRFVPSNAVNAIFYTGHRSTGGLTAIGDTVANLQEGALLKRYQVDVIDREKLDAAVITLGSTRISLVIELASKSTAQGIKHTEIRRVKIEYQFGRQLADAMADVTSVCDFMSMMLGVVISPGDMDVALNGPGVSSPNQFSIHGTFRTPGKKLRSSEAYEAIMSPEANRESYERAFAIWMARRSEWQQADALGIENLQMEGRLDRGRFLNAVGWFEAIPEIYARTKPKIPKAAIRKAVVAAAKSLSGDGHEGLQERVSNLIGMLNAPTLASRLEQAAIFLRSRYGKSILPNDLEQNVPIIAAIRNNFAHGDDAFLGKNSDRVHEMMLATEAICHLLTLDGLWSADDNRSLAFGHILAQKLRNLGEIAKARSAMSG